MADVDHGDCQEECNCYEKGFDHGWDSAMGQVLDWRLGNHADGCPCELCTYSLGIVVNALEDLADALKGELGNRPPSPAPESPEMTVDSGQDF